MVKDTIVVPVGFDFTVNVVILECPVLSVILQCFVSARSPLSASAPMCGNSCGRGSSSKLSGNGIPVAPDAFGYGFRIVILQ